MLFNTLNDTSESASSVLSPAVATVCVLDVSPTANVTICSPSATMSRPALSSTHSLTVNGFDGAGDAVTVKLNVAPSTTDVCVVLTEMTGSVARTKVGDSP